MLKSLLCVVACAAAASVSGQTAGAGSTGAAPPINFTLPLGVDSTGKLDEHYLLIPSSNDFDEFEFDLLNHLPLRILVRADIQAIWKHFPAVNGSDVGAICLMKGTPLSMISKYYDIASADVRGYDLRLWLDESCQTVNVGFLFYDAEGGQNLELYVRDAETDEPIFDGELEPGVTQYRVTDLLRRYLVADPARRYADQIINVLNSGVFIMGKPVSTVNASVVIPSDYQATELKKFQEQAKSMIVRTFSASGYAKVKVPDNVKVGLMSYTSNNKKYIGAEEVNKSAFEFNWNQVDVMKIPLVPSVATEFGQNMMETVENFTNVAMEFTLAQGIRIYQKGAVQFIDTPFAEESAIMVRLNVDQDKAWAYDVVDPQGVSHKVELAPGEALIYEACKSAVARVTPFEGSAYSELVLHYIPVRDPLWFKNDSTTVIAEEDYYPINEEELQVQDDEYAQNDEEFNQNDDGEEQNWQEQDGEGEGEGQQFDDEFQGEEQQQQDGGFEEEDQQQQQGDDAYEQQEQQQDEGEQQSQDDEDGGSADPYVQAGEEL